MSSATKAQPSQEIRILDEAEIDSVAGGTGVAAVVSAFFTCLKSCADSKGQVQRELARFS